MKKEEFVALGIDEKLAEKASKKELSGYVPKEHFDEVDESRKKLEESVKDYEQQLDTVKAAAGDNEALKQKISELQEQNKQKDEEYQSQLKDLRLTNAIKLAVSTDAQDSDLVAGLIDKEKLILGNDGKVTGLDEQVKELRESKAFLFKEKQTDKQDTQPPGFRIGVTQQSTADTRTNGKVSMKDAIASRLQTQPQAGQVKE